MKSLLGVAACLLMSCAVSQSELPQSRFDGDWQAVMRVTEPVQQVQGWRFDCAPFTNSFFIRVKNGVASGFLEADENYSFRTSVDQRGQFEAIIPTNSVYLYKESPIRRNSRIVLELSGSLSGQKGSGTFVVGDEAVDGQGCTTSVQFIEV